MKRIEFKLPEGFSIPTGKMPGDDIEVLATLRLKENGSSACIVELDGVPMPGYDDKGDGKMETNESRFSDRMKEAYPESE